MVELGDRGKRAVRMRCSIISASRRLHSALCTPLTHGPAQFQFSNDRRQSSLGTYMLTWHRKKGCTSSSTLSISLFSPIALIASQYNGKITITLQLPFSGYPANFVRFPLLDDSSDSGVESGCQMITALTDGTSLSFVRLGLRDI